MGGMGGMPGMGDMGGFGGDGGFGNIDFSKLGSGPGGPSADLPEDSDDENLPSDDEEVPGLEGDGSSAPAAKKIEEIE